ncbi:MAG TPA: hypothetical protein DEG69_11355 [Flavobacteriaceae bacterium]|nr:hypothetical protein [Flavobacteriaceae bacterium]
MMTTTKKTTRTTKTVTVAAKSSTNLNLPKNPFMFEILDLVSRQRSKAKKVEVLKKYEELSLKGILIWNFDDSIVTLLPEGEVPYADPEDQVTYSGTLSTKIDQSVRKLHESGSFSLGAGDSQGRTTIRREFKNFYQFVKGGNPGLNGIRRETMFINILQGLHPLEAEILCLVKDGNLEDKYKITKEVVSEAYSDIQWGGRS